MSKSKIAQRAFKNKKKPIVIAEAIYEPDIKEFWRIVDHAFEYGCVESTENHFVSWYEQLSSNMNDKKFKNCLDNSLTLYISCYAGNILSWLGKFPDEKFEWICFRRYHTDDKLKIYKFKKFKNKILKGKHYG